MTRGCTLAVGMSRSCMLRSNPRSMLLLLREMLQGIPPLLLLQGTGGVLLLNWRCVGVQPVKEIQVGGGGEGTGGRGAGGWCTAG